MRKLFVFFFTGLLVLGAAGIASGAALNWQGTLIVDMTDFGRGIATGGGVATVNGSHGIIPAHIQTLRLAASRGHVQGTSTNIVTDPAMAGMIGAVIYSQMQGGTGTFHDISGAAASTGALTSGVMPIQGYVKVCLLSTVCTQFLGGPFTLPTTVNGVAGTGRKGLGIGGTLTLGGYGGIRMSLEHAPWTVKSLTVVDHITTEEGGLMMIPIVAKGWAHAPVSTTTSTAQPSGMLQLVTPNQARTNLPIGSNAKIGSTAVLIIHFIPEPGLLLLLGSGVFGLALMGRARMRR